MLALAATVITGSAYAQVDNTKTNTDSTVIKSDSTSTPPTEDKKDEKTPPHAFTPTLQNNNFTLVAINREIMGSKTVEVEKEEA